MKLKICIASVLFEAFHKALDWVVIKGLIYTGRLQVDR